MLLVPGLALLAAAAALTVWAMQAQPDPMDHQAAAQRLAQDWAQAQVSGLLLPVTDSFAQIGNDIAARGLSTPEQLRAALARRETAEILLAPLRRLPQGGSAMVIDPWGRPLTAGTASPAMLDNVALKTRRDGAATPWAVPMLAADGSSVGLVLGARLVSAQGDWLGTVLTASPAPILSPIAPNTGPATWLAAADGTILAGPAGPPGPGTVREPTGVPGLVLVLSPVPPGSAPSVLIPWVFALMAALLAAALLAGATLLQARQRPLLAYANPEEAARTATHLAAVELMLDHMDQGVLLISAAGIVEVCNRRACDLFQLPAELMARRPAMDEIMAYQWRENLFEHTTNDVRLLIRTGGIPGNAQRYERQTTHGRTIEVVSVPLQGGGMVRTVMDITERKAAERSLAFVAHHDELTQLANRAAVRDRLERELLTAAGTTTEIAVLYLDLDRFKLVNDTRGHAVGDALLAEVGLRLRTTVRSGDLVGRIGGDEFAILLLNTSSNAVVTSIATDLLHRVSEPYIIDGEASMIGISIGVALFPRDGATADHLLRNADSALYRAKHAGRGVVRFFESSDDELDRTLLQMESDLRSALERHQFEVAYQPIVDCQTGEPVSFEALLRWHHPERGLVPPAEFIPVAEATGLIGPIGLWVMETACREAAGWPSPTRVSINLSPGQFQQQDLDRQIAAILDRTGLHPGRLELEVTEGVLLARTEAVRRAMQALKQRGIRLVLDDFGTAHSSFSYLLSFPFAQIKIDKSFVWALGSDDSAKAIVEAVLGMARAMRLDVVAEGVETEAQLGWVRAMGCRFAQGHLFGMPAPAALTKEYLAGAGRPPRTVFAEAIAGQA